jgi:hypothetical protein
MSLDDVPVDAVGISWEQWMEQQRERIFAEARANRRAASGPSALAGSPMLQETTQHPLVPAVQAALPLATRIVRSDLSVLANIGSG